MALPSLQDTLGPAVEMLTDPLDPSFIEQARRWTDIDREIPAAIVLPRSEGHCQKVVQWAVGAGIPFVVRSGGHSQWSTIGDDGIVIDLTRMAAVQVDKEAQTATVVGSVLSKQLSVALAEQGLFTALGNGNTVGVMGYFLGGGSSITNSITGFGSDQILGARLITAKGELIDADEELLYGIRGAGHFFGLVTQLTIRAYPLSDLGNDQGLIWSGIFAFPLSQVREVCAAMDVIMNDSSHATAGLIMVMSPPPTRKPTIVISARYTGLPENAATAYRLLYDLNPVMSNGSAVPIQNASDAREAMGAKGDFKRFDVVGLHHFNTDSFVETVRLYSDMIDECPDAINSAFNFQWAARSPRKPDFESANCLHDIRYWQNNLIWHTDSKSQARVSEYSFKTLPIMRGEATDLVDFVNGTRTEPLDRRYRGDARLNRLRALKKKWDPAGIFTNQLL
ncbi:FAD binding domain containing protein [Rutstroemia sp. NJR-2017a BVV2]|nr:FAD binding domain containing protein [Rutstroemia sp. NJR-2017a BVV2]